MGSDQFGKMFLIFRLTDQAFWRRAALIVYDGFLIIIVFWLTYLLRLSNPWPLQLQEQISLLQLLLPIGIGVLVFTGWYKGLVRYASSRSLYGLLPRVALILLLVAILRPFVHLPAPPRSFWAFFWLLFCSICIASRVLIRDALRMLASWNQSKVSRWPFAIKRSARFALKPKRTIVYGAGEAGSRLLEALRFDPRWQVVAVIDDNPSLSIWGRRLQGWPIYQPDQLPDLIQNLAITSALLAIPLANRVRQRELIHSLSLMGLEVMTMPSVADIVSGQVRVDDLRHVKIEDLLGREPSNPNPYLLEAAVRDRCVLISGAGGSIGSELARQVLQLAPRRLILLEQSEYALYAIEKELKQVISSACLETFDCLRAVLGDVSRQKDMEKLCRMENVEVVFHAAAYKHVPLVERNPSSGIRNNILGTQSLLEASISTGVERFTLISTDKAVRPTNAMGASKRVCELLVQEAANRQTKTVCSMVRFGNVLGSSGSVVPLFREQIAAGGPVTVTHPDVIRYFMTIAEAVQLVLQASALAQGGEVFLLDMGDPVSIKELACQMIELSGYSVLDEDRPNGDIEIQYTGLRPGEKLYEELLVNPDDTPTEHPLIRKAVESPPTSKLLHEAVSELLSVAECGNDLIVLEKLKTLVPDYKNTPLC